MRGGDGKEGGIGRNKEEEGREREVAEAAISRKDITAPPTSSYSRPTFLVICGLGRLQNKHGRDRPSSLVFAAAIIPLSPVDLAAAPKRDTGPPSELRSGSKRAGERANEKMSE